MTACLLRQETACSTGMKNVLMRDGYTISPRIDGDARVGIVYEHGRNEMQPKNLCNGKAMVPVQNNAAHIVNYDGRRPKVGRPDLHAQGCRMYMVMKLVRLQRRRFDKGNVAVIYKWRERDQRVTGVD